MQDNDPNTAFSIFKRASSLLATLEELEADFISQLSYAETLAESIEAEKCIDLGAGKVGLGEKKAAADEKVIATWKKFFDKKKELGQLVANIKYMTRIYYDAKSCYENASKKYRQEKND
jgi:hypothetical protein